MLALPTPLGSAARDAFHRKAPKSRFLHAIDEYAKAAQAMIPLEGSVDINNPAAASRGPPPAAMRREVQNAAEQSGAHDTELALEGAGDTGQNNSGDGGFTASLNHRDDRVPAPTSPVRASQPPIVVRARRGLSGDDVDDHDHDHERGDSEWPDRFYEPGDEGGNERNNKARRDDARGQSGRSFGNNNNQRTQPKNSTGYGNYYEHGDLVGTGYTGTAELGGLTCVVHHASRKHAEKEKRTHSLIDCRSYFRRFVCLCD